MAAIDVLRQAVADARAAGFFTPPTSADAVYPAGNVPSTDTTMLLRLAILALRDTYVRQQQLVAQVQTNTADIAAIKTKIGL